jgi:NCS1 nucleoside transporter family
MADTYEKDVEAGVEPGKEAYVSEEKPKHSPEIRRDSTTPLAEVAKARHIQTAWAPFRYMSMGEAWLDQKLGIETQGIDRIPEEDKRPPHLINTFLMWFSMTCHVGTLPIGILGPIYGLSFKQSVGSIVGGTFLGAMCTAYTGTLGPKTGLRQIATSRYSFGFYGAKLCSVLNVVIGAGFAVVNVVVCGQILSAVSDYTMTISVGCVIVALISYLVSVFGFALIHTYEKYSWIMSFILLLILIGQTSKYVAVDAPPFDSGLSLAGAILSYIALNFSSASGWCSIAADYYCNYPATTKTWKVYGLTLSGVTIGTCFVTIIGACMGSAAAGAGADPRLAAAYNGHGVGGLLRELYHPINFSKFCLVLCTFTVIGNNIAINYSSGLSMQLLGHHFHAIPRFIWSFLVALVVAILAIVGKDHLANIVSDFVSLLGYWTISFTFILLIEDQWFRRREGYQLEGWNDVHKLPWGAAATFTLVTSYLAGGLPGMAQVWYVGPIAKKFGPYGGDVGVYMSGAITLLLYPPLRSFEKKKTGR